MADPSPSVFARLAALPFGERRRIEDELHYLGARDASPGGTLDRVAEARLLAMVEEVERRVSAASPGTAPGSAGNRGPTMAHNRTGGMGGLPQHPRTSSAAGATAAASAAVAAAVQEERRRLMAEVHELPADLDQALAVAVAHARLAQQAGADDSKVRTILGLYVRQLWQRPSVRSEFGSVAELDALADFKMTGGARPRRKRGR